VRPCPPSPFPSEFECPWCALENAPVRIVPACSGRRLVDGETSREFAAHTHIAHEAFGTCLASLAVQELDKLQSLVRARIRC